MVLGLAEEQAVSFQRRGGLANGPLVNTEGPGRIFTTVWLERPLRGTAEKEGCDGQVRQG